MKRFIISSMLIVICLFSIVSCGSDEVVCIPSTQEQEAQDFEDFLQSLDSLNDAYSSQTRSQDIQQYLNEDPVNLGPEGFSIRNVSISCAADWAGRIAGNYGGQWAGGFLGGTLTGGTPVGIIAGCWLGKKYGGVIGGTIASAIAKELVYGCQCAVSTSSQDDNYHINKFIYNAEIRSNDCDSLGYYHNYVMCTLLDDPGKYINGDNTVNVDQLYDDIINCLAKLLGTDVALYTDTQTKQYFIEQVKIFHANGLEFAQGDISYEELLEKNETVLVRNFKIDATIARKSTQIATSVYYEIAALDEEQTQRYAKDLNRIIEKSSLCVADRELVRRNSEILINSKLCWTANERTTVFE